MRRFLWFLSREIGVPYDLRAMGSVFFLVSLRPGLLFGIWFVFSCWVVVLLGFSMGCMFSRLRVGVELPGGWLEGVGVGIWVMTIRLRLARRSNCIGRCPDRLRGRMVFS